MLETFLACESSAEGIAFGRQKSTAWMSVKMNRILARDKWVLRRAATQIGKSSLVWNFILGGRRHTWDGLLLLRYEDRSDQEPRPR